MTTPGSDIRDQTTPDIDRIEHDIAQTRQELGETVEALSARLDLKARAKQRIAATKQRAQNAATDEDGRLKPVVSVGGAMMAALTLVGLLLVWKGRRQ
jgi:hypothetical protein